MPRFDKVSNEGTPTHLLLCGDTKTGKSDYVARAILDGYYCLYFDSDNGGGTLSQLLPVGHPARHRLIYFPTKKPYAILKNFTETGVFRWNTTQDKEFLTPHGHNPDDEISEIRPARIPAGFLVVFDSWTSISIDAMRIAAKDNGVTLTDMGRKKRNVYGDASIRLNSALDILQSIRPHLIVQAHGQFYERKEKPANKIQEDIDEADMIIKENILVPTSCSQPHGHGMGKFFNQIGWMTVDKNGNRQLDFTVKTDRIGGGSVTGMGDPHGAYSFKNLFGEPLEFSDEQIEGFCKEYLVKEYQPPQGAGKSAASPAAPTGDLPPAGTPASVQSKPSGLTALLKK